VAQNENWLGSNVIFIVVGVVLVLLMAFLAWDWLRGGDDEELSETSRTPLYDTGEFDPFEGGYPVPPMPGQVLPELVGVLRSSSSEPFTEPESVTEPERDDA
jgi:NADH-quinone oxidoreductase subunit H